MSYTRTYNKTISERITKRVSVSRSLDKDGNVTRIDVDIDNSRHSFAASGGSRNIDIRAEIPVTIDIEVDTRTFDKSVDNCNSNVNLLTGAVVATEAAQVASIQENSEKVAGTIVNGFFGYIRSEISQQINELTQNIDAQLMHLRELSVACVDKKRQMDVDFTRISSRYIKIFDDLNQELYNRIHELDKPTFIFRKELDGQQDRYSQNDLINTVSVAGKESSALLTKMSISVAKKRAMDTISQAKIFLWQQNKLNKTIQKSKLNESIETKHFTPVCFIELQRESGQISKEIYSPTYINALQNEDSKNRMIEQIYSEKQTWSVIDAETTENIQNQFNKVLNQNYEALDPHSLRVKKMIEKMANLAQMNVINY
jgi:hypothetical protein